MKSGFRTLRVFDGLIDRVLCVLGAVLFSQGPEFMQQYLQRLGGHLQEAQRQLGLFREAATSRSRRTLEQFIAQTHTNPDAGVVQLGAVMNDAVARTASLQAAHDTLASSSLWMRPVVFLEHLDIGIAQATWSAYLPAVPTTLEGLLYALTGMTIFASLLYQFGATKCLLGLLPPQTGARHLPSRPGRPPAQKNFFALSKKLFETGSSASPHAWPEILELLLLLGIQRGGGPPHARG